MTRAHLEREYRLKFREDEYGDPVVIGRFGQLYLDGNKLCLMSTDGPLRDPKRWRQLGGRLWRGDISKNPEGKRVQDIEVKDIDPAEIRLAIRLAGIRPKRVMSEAQRKAAAVGLAKIHRTPPQESRNGQKNDDGGLG